MAHIPLPLRKVAATGTICCLHCKGDVFKLVVDMSDFIGRVRGGDIVNSGEGGVSIQRLIGIVCHSCGEEYPYGKADVK